MSGETIEAPVRGIVVAAMLAGEAKLCMGLRLAGVGGVGEAISWSW